MILSDLSQGTVLHDDGVGTVRCREPNALPIRGGAFYVTNPCSEHDADRAILVLDNKKV